MKVNRPAVLQRIEDLQHQRHSCLKLAVAEHMKTATTDKPNRRVNVLRLEASTHCYSAVQILNEEIKRLKSLLAGNSG